MKSDQLHVVDSKDIKNWNDFVHNHPNGNIFQTTEMSEVYQKTKNCDPIGLAVVNDTEEILALMQAVIITEKFDFMGSFTGRSVIQGGPLFVEGDIGRKAVAALMSTYDEIARKKALYTQIRNMWDTSNISNLLNGMRYNYEEHLNFLVSLNRPEEDIWKDIHKSRRKGINRFEKSGITIEIIHNKKDIKVFYDIVSETYANVKLPLDDYSFFESVFDLLASKNMAKFYLAKYEDVYVGARATLNYKGTIYDWFAGSLSKYSSSYINEGLVWCILKENANKGDQIFDFGGAGNPNEEYGVREFKSRFGGKMTNFGRYKKVHSPVKMLIANKGFEIYKRLVL